MEIHQQYEVCGNCGGDAIFAIRMNGPKQMSLWTLPLIPTGVRIDAWLCRKCLEETVPRPARVQLQRLHPVRPNYPIELVADLDPATGQRRPARNRSHFRKPARRRNRRFK
jgi:hypothetical protein